MKAISIRQPWADLIVHGKKTLELRSWSITYRGPLAIHASQTIDREACAANGIDPDSVTTGAIIGTVDLVDMIELDKAAFSNHRSEHLASGLFEPPLYGWQLEHPQSLPQPRPIRGRMGLFNVSEEWLQAKNGGAPEPEPALPALEPTWNPERPFELRVVAETDRTRHTAYRLALFQRMIEPPSAQRTMYREAPPDLQPIVEVGGSVLRAVADHVLEALKRSGYKATDLNANRREPFLLSEESGVRLGLLFLAIKPIAKMNRVEAISHGLRTMTSEEAYYWYSKCTTSLTAERAQKALRVLLASD
jgi:hypothetical protein